MFFINVVVYITLWKQGKLSHSPYFYPLIIIIIDVYYVHHENMCWRSSKRYSSSHDMFYNWVISQEAITVLATDAWQPCFAKFACMVSACVLCGLCYCWLACLYLMDTNLAESWNVLTSVGFRHIYFILSFGQSYRIRILYFLIIIVWWRNLI